MRLILTSIFILTSMLTSCSVMTKVAEVTKVAEIAEVSILKYKFIPEVLEIKKGQTVRWINKEKRQYHSVWFEKNGEDESDYLFPDDSLDKTFNEPGEYEYRCGPHPEMIAKIIVK